MVERIGRYEVHAELGRGGFGQVFRAYDPVVGRAVAIKTLTAAGDPELLTRFRNEAGATGKLRHPNIIVVYDFGEQNGAPYLVMELLEGEDLERVLSSGRRLKLLESVNVMTQVGSGLQHAHVSGIVHRDVKPANIMLLSNGSIKIMDFGIALLTQATEARLTPQGSLIGTFPYMAPEQFYGAASDALTDIFAFGVTFYKLLTGVHPFHASEMAGVMFNIVNKTPAAIRELNPECPEALEEAVFKTLSKDRDARYQSFDDVLFDLEPIIVELRKERTAELIAEARDRMTASQFDEAQSVIRQALEIDPTNRTARELRERLQREIKERNLRPRIAALVDKGREQLRARQYDDAIQKFESALRLDQSSPEIHSLLDEARAAWEKAQRSERLIKEAHRAFEAGDFTAAHKGISDALSLSPDDQPAQGLLQAIQSQIEARNRERRLGEALSQARGLILLQNFEESIKLLSSLQPEYPESTELPQLLARAIEERDALARAQRLQTAVRDIKDLLKDRRFSDALATLASLVEEFPESTELRELGSYAREELKAQQQAEAVAKVTAQVRGALATGQLDTAIEQIRSALVEHPTASVLRELLQSTLSAKAEHERSTALEAATQEVRSLLGVNRFSEALDKIESFTRAYGEAAILESLRRTAEDGLEKQRRILAIRKLLMQGQGLIDQGRPGTASEVLEQATIEFPGDRNLTQLLDLARNKLLEQQQAEAISKLIEEAETLARSSQFETALERLEAGFQQFPDNPRLRRCKDAIVAQRARQERERLRRQALDQINELKVQRKLKEAADALRNAVESFGEDQETVALTRSVDEASAELQREQEISSTIQTARRLLDDLQPSSAVQALREVLAKYPNAPALVELINLAEEQERNQRRAADIELILTTARQQLDSDQFHDALQALDDGLKKYPGHKELEEQRERTLAVKTEQERRAALASAHAEILKLARADRLQDALSAAHTAIAQFGDESVLVATRTDLEQEIEERSRAELLQTTKQQITTQFSRGALQEARKAAQLALTEFRDDPELLQLLHQIEESIERARHEVEIQAAIQQTRDFADASQFDRAYSALDAAILSHPDARNLQQLRREIQDRQTRLDILNRAREQHASGNFEEALQTVELGLRQTPADREWLALKNQVERDLQARRRAEAMRAAIQSAESMLREKRYRQGIAILDEVLRQSGPSNDAVALRERLLQALTTQEKAEARKRDLDQLLALRQRLGPELGKQRLKAVSLEIRRLAQNNEQDEEFARRARELQMEIRALQPAPKPIPWRTIGAVAAAILVVGISVVLIVRGLRRPVTPPAPVPVTLQVRSDPAGATVRLNDQSCLTPACSFSLPPGEYQIRASLSGYKDLQQSVKIDAGRQAPPLNLTLDPIPPPSLPPAGPKTGTLVVQTSAPKTLVTVDGTPRGRTDEQGALKLPLDAALHTIEVTKPGYDMLPAQRVRVTAGSSQSVSFELSLQKARLELRGAPAGAAIRINNAFVGTTRGTTFSVPVTPGQQTLEIAQGTTNLRLPQNFEPGQTITLNWAEVAPRPAKTTPSAPPPAPAPVLSAEQQDWDRVQNSSNRSDLSTFLSKYPNSTHAADATARLDDLNWNAVNRADAQSVQAFLSRDPGSSHRAEAQALLSQLQQPKPETPLKTEPPKTEPQRIEPAKTEPQQLEPPKAQPKEPVPASDADSRAVRAAIDEFNAAFQDKQPRELKKIWPSVPDTTTKAMRLPGAIYLMVLRPVGEAQITNDSAIVPCDLTTTVTIRGQTTDKQRQVQVLLQKNAGSWSIVNPFGTPR